MDKIIPNGEEVLLFHKIQDIHHRNVNKTKYIKGVVISSRYSENLSYHGSEWYERIYTVIDDEGKSYEATHNIAYIGPFYIRTIKEHIVNLREAIQDNYDKMKELYADNEIISKSLQELELISLEMKENGPIRKLDK